MMPKRNIFIFVFYCLVSLAVFTAALVSPLARHYAGAPLRDALLPKPAPVVVRARRLAAPLPAEGVAERQDA